MKTELEKDLTAGIGQDASHRHAEEVGPVTSVEESEKREQSEILSLFGTIDFDPTYDYKQGRQRGRVPAGNS